MHAPRFVPIVLLLSWLILIGYWLYSARNLKPVVHRQDRGSRARYLVFMAASFVLLLQLSRRIPILNTQILPHTHPVALFGALICVAGTIFAIWARHILAGNWSGAVTLKDDHELIQRGPYAIVRNPIYTGILMMYLGTAIARGDGGPLLGLVCVFIGIWIKLRQEEQLMLAHFPETYPAYSARVKRLIPYVL